MSATALVKLLLIAATFASALIYLILGSRMGGVAAPLDQSRGGLAVRVIVQASKDSATVARILAILVPIRRQSPVPDFDWAISNSRTVPTSEPMLRAAVRKWRILLDASSSAFGFGA